MNNMPTVAFHDLIIHPRDADLIAGTHGRSLWILDDITPLQQLTEKVKQKDVHMFKNRVATKWLELDMGDNQVYFEFRGENQPRRASVCFWLKNDTWGEASMIITDVTGKYSKTIDFQPHQGINRVRWNLEFPVPESKIEKFRQTMLTAVDEIKGEKLTRDQKSKLEGFRSSIESAEGIRELNDAYIQLTFNFGQYAKGRPIFGKQLNYSFEAPAGKYKVTLNVNDIEYHGFVEVREDPML